jgi:hypothetical protein
MEFQGGDKRNPANWITTVLYKGDSTIYTAFNIKDSLGIVDTVKTVDPSFVSKFWARKTDLDGDGKEDIICPYQALTDTIAITKRTWNTTTSQFDTLKYSITNPKRHSLRVVEGSATTGIEAKDFTIIMPDQYTLEQNYPNPFNPMTTIAFVLPIRDRISLKIYDALGREVRTLINNEEHAAGRSTIVWNGRNDAGRPVSSGTYFYTLIHGNFRTTNKMSLVK